MTSPASNPAGLPLRSAALTSPQTVTDAISIEEATMNPVRVRPRPRSSSRRSPVVVDLTTVGGARAESAADVPLLSVVVPAYQEEARIEATLRELAHHLVCIDRADAEVIVVAATRADGTSDRTAQIVGEVQGLFRDLRLLRPGRRAGKGRDVRVGMLAARGRVRVFMDADLATPLHHLEVALDLVLAGHPTVIGVRDLTSSHQGLRKAISSVGNRVVRTVLLPAITDTQCGFKMFTASVTEHVFGRQTIDGWGFDMEVLAIGRRLGVPITIVEIPDWTDVSGGTFSQAPLSGALRTLQDLLLITWRMTTGRYRSLAPAAPRVLPVPLSLVVEDVRQVPVGRAS